MLLNFVLGTEVQNKFRCAVWCPSKYYPCYKPLASFPGSPPARWWWKVLFVIVMWGESLWTRLQTTTCVVCTCRMMDPHHSLILAPWGRDSWAWEWDQEWSIVAAASCAYCALIDFSAMLWITDESLQGTWLKKWPAQTWAGQTTSASTGIIC